MSIPSPDVAVLSRLLDKALDVNAGAREAWLVGLPAEQQHLVPTLQQMLAERDRRATSGFLSALPVINEASHPDESVAHPGELIGAYRLIREIGRGGMGAVWLAERADGAYKRQVALKLPRLIWGAGLAKRMARERDIGAMLEHPNIARLYDAGVDDKGRPYMALEYIDGVAIDTWCKDMKLSVHDKLQLIVQVAKAVAYAHGRLIVHRDLKPSNVLVSADGQVHLLDFGIARMLDGASEPQHQATQEQARAMTPHYASPEQLKGEAVTVQSDVYSLGVLMYELLTGSTPHDPKRKSAVALEKAILQGDAALPSTRVLNEVAAKQIKGDIDAIVGKALKLHLQERYATAEALAADIERFLRGETVAARTDSTSYRLSKALRRHWIGASATAAVLIAVLGGAAIAVVQAQRATQAVEKERVIKAFVTDVFRTNLTTIGLNTSLRADNSPHALTQRGAKLIEQRFSDQPALQAELYAVVGNVFSDMGAYGLAAEYARRQVEMLQSLRAPPSELAEAWLALGHALDDDRRFAEAEGPARQALALARGNVALEARALVLQAGIVIETGKSAEAAVLLDRAASKLSVVTDKLSEPRALVLAFRAILVTNTNRFDEALPLYLKALEIAKQGEIGERSRAAVTINLMLARQLLVAGDAKRAELHYESAITALRSQGGVYEARAAMEAGRYAYRKRRLGTRSASESLQTLTQSRDTIARLEVPVPDSFIPRLEVWMAAIKASLGDLAGALPLLDRNVHLYDRLGGVSDKIEVSKTFAWTYLQAGRYEDADRWFTRSREQSAALSVNGPTPYEAYRYIASATELMMQGRHSQALAVLDSTPHFDSVRGVRAVDANLHLRELDWTRAKILLAQGLGSTALPVLERSAPVSGEDEETQADYTRILGEANCMTGDSVHGGATLRRQVAEDERKSQYPHSPWLARTRAVAGLCALHAGDHRSAFAWARQARESLTLQSEVSDYYKAPLRELEARLDQLKPKQSKRR